MSNQTNIELRKLINIGLDGKEHETSYGIFIYDDYSKDYYNLFTSFKELKDEINGKCDRSINSPYLCLLSYILNEEILTECEGIEILRYIYENKEGIIICGKWLDFKEIKPILKKYFD